MEQENASRKDSETITVAFAIVFIVLLLASNWFGFGMTLLLISHTIISLIAAGIGKGRKIGFITAFFVSFLTSIVVGFIIVFNSPKLKDEEYKLKMLELTGSNNKASASVADELLKLNELRKEGIITEEEFAVQKSKVLNS